MWQILYQIPTTNKWRFQGIPDLEANKICKRCELDIEDTKHCLWDCPKAREIWAWVSFLTPLTSLDPNRTISLSPQQVLLGDALNCLPAIPQHWWVALRVMTLWHIWCDQNAEVRQDQGSPHHTKAHIRQQLHAYLRVAWSKLRVRVDAGSIADDKAIEIFRFNFGFHKKVC